jgi:hypothetical protein
MQHALYLIAEDVTPDLAEIDRQINALSSTIRRLPDRKINTRVHIDMIKARRELMNTRDGLINRQCELALVD